MGGDQLWYTEVGRRLAEGGIAAGGEDLVARPPATAALVALCHTVAGDGDLILVRLVFALLGGVSCVLLARLAHRTAPGLAALPALTAWVWALAPDGIERAAAIQSENIFVPLLLAYMLAVGSVLVEPRARHVALAGVLAAGMLLVRYDAVLAVCAIPLLLAAKRRIDGRAMASGLLGMVAVAAVAVALLLPCVTWARRLLPPGGIGATNVHAALARKAGLGRWLGTVSLRRPDWLSIWWERPGTLDAALIPQRAFHDAAERMEVLDVFDRAHRIGEYTPRFNAEIAAVADARIRRSPLRHALLMPLHRAGGIWLDPWSTDATRRLETRTRTPLGWAFHGAGVAYLALLGLGFLAAHWELLRPRAAAWPLAALVLLHTYSMVGLLAWVWVRPAYELRFVVPVHALALLLAANLLLRIRRALPAVLPAGGRSAALDRQQSGDRHNAEEGPR